MTSLIVKQITKRILGETVANKFGTDDPYFEQVPATRLDGRPSKKFKKVRKALPPGLSDHDAQVLTKVKRRAYRLDMSLFHCCGIRFGWSSVLAIIPFLGDALDAFMAMMVIRTAEEVEGGLPADVIMRMYFNVMLDFGIGLVPIIGDIADAVYRCNTRNAAILEAHLRQKGKKRLQSGGHAIPADPSDPDEFDRFHSEPPPQYTASQPARQANMSPAATTTHPGQTTGVTAPSQAKAHDSNRGGFFSNFGTKKSRPADVEMAVTNPQGRASRPRQA